MQFGFQGLHLGPPTLVEVLADHCRYTPEHELEFYYGWDWDDDDVSDEDYQGLLLDETSESDNGSVQ
jgi:hypothetical protein